MNKDVLKGSGLVLGSAFFFATYGVWSKLMVGHFGEFNQAWVRGLILLLVLVPVGLITKSFKPVRRGDVKWFVFISLCGGLNQAPYFWGFEHLPIGTATLLFYVALTFGTYIIGKFFFSEVMTKTKLIALGLAVVGLSIIYRFVLGSEQVFPALATIAAGMMGACFVVFSKKVSGQYSEAQILITCFVAVVFCNMLIGGIVGEGIPVFEFNKAWAAQLGYSASYLIANMAVIAGFKYLAPSIGGLIGLFEVIFAIVFGVVLFGEVLSLKVILGMMIVIMAIGLPELANLSFVKKLVSK